MGQVSHRSGAAEAGNASDWTELERGFFAAAPPDVAVQPPPAASFDDLGPIEPVRERRRRAAGRRTDGGPERRRRGASALGFFRRIAQQAGATAGPVVARAWRWTSARARLEARRVGSASLRLAPGLRAARDSLGRSLGALISRLAGDLPERPDGKTIVAAIAALIVVFGVSASVLGSRSNPRRLAPVAPAVAVVAAPAAAAVAMAQPPVAPSAPEAAPAPAPEAALAAASAAPAVRAAPQRHRAKRHVARGAIAPLHAHARSFAR